MGDERLQLTNENISIGTLIEYIKASIETLMTIKMDGNKETICKKCKAKLPEKKKEILDENFQINSINSSGNVRLDSSRKFEMSDNPKSS